MTRAEYNESKKVFEQFKKELAAETAVECKWVLSFAQYKNHTATAFISDMRSYESVIDSWKPYLDGENDHMREMAKAVITAETELIEKYGTVENYTEAVVNTIINSNAFERFAAAFGITGYSTEIKHECGHDYKYLRLHY